LNGGKEIHTHRNDHKGSNLNLGGCRINRPGRWERLGGLGLGRRRAGGEKKTAGDQKVETRSGGKKSKARVEDTSVGGKETRQNSVGHLGEERKAQHGPKGKKRGALAK